LIFLLAVFERAAGLTTKMRERDNAVRSDSPTPNRLVRSHDPAFGEKIFYVTEAANKQSVP
jgi:hypothetical protein